VTWSAR